MPLGQQMEGRVTSSGLDSPVGTKVAIVTGASRGIGRGIAERLLETGTAWLQTREISHRPKRCSPEIG
jgi:hypothetical protein